VSDVAAIGAAPQVGGFALAGARVYPVDTAEQARQAWRGMPDTVAVVILTATAAEAIGADRTATQAPLTIVLP
jgi:vacuolar-type H+-ATPase subunit F/Vma7